MKKLILCLLLLSNALALENNLNQEAEFEKWYEKELFINKKDFGFCLCVSEFYKDQNLPKEIKEAYKAFNSAEIIDPGEMDYFLDFIKTSINNFMPNFKHPERYPKKWYFLACLGMYNSKEYEDMILRKGKYEQKYKGFLQKWRDELDRMEKQ